MSDNQDDEFFEPVYRPEWAREKPSDTAARELVRSTYEARIRKALDSRNDVPEQVAAERLNAWETAEFGTKKERDLLTHLKQREPHNQGSQQ